MTIQEQLLDKAHNKKRAIEIAVAAASSQQAFAKLMACFVSNNYRLAQRAAWSVSYAAGMKQELIFPYIKNLVAQLLRNDVHNAVIRNSVRILRQIQIPEEHHGELMNACFLLAEKRETPIAIKAFSLSILHHLSLVYPDIKPELGALAEANLMSESAGIKSVCNNILKKLRKSKTPGINH